jgi:hypothetical protein
MGGAPLDERAPAGGRPGGGLRLLPGGRVRSGVGAWGVKPPIARFRSPGSAEEVTIRLELPKLEVVLRLYEEGRRLWRCWAPAVKEAAVDVADGREF